MEVPCVQGFVSLYHWKSPEALVITVDPEEEVDIIDDPVLRPPSASQWDMGLSYLFECNHTGRSPQSPPYNPQASEIVPIPSSNLRTPSEPSTPKGSSVPQPLVCSSDNFKYCGTY